MKNLRAEKALKDACVKLGENIGSVNRLTAFLSDAIPEEKDFIHLIVTAHRFSIVRTFPASIQGDRAEIKNRAARFLDEELIQSAHLAPEAAVWTLNAWLSALGLAHQVEPIKQSAAFSPTRAASNVTQLPNSLKTVGSGLIGTLCLLLLVAAALLFIYFDVLGKSQADRHGEPIDAASQ